MATNLYEILEVLQDAPPEDIRKAYKRRALKTHPDRLAPNATAAEKADSEEKFRKVNNAYEILIDPTKRRLYDQHGVWPPPEQDQRRSSPQSSRHSFRSPPRTNTYPHPFSYSNFQFTNPFVLFDTIFGELSRPFGRDARWPESSSNGLHSHFENLFRALEQDLFTDSDRDFASGPLFSRSIFPSPFHGFPSLTPPPLGQGAFASETFYSQTINGVSRSVHKRRGWDGTEEEMRTYTDGRKVHTIDGIEQPQPPSNTHFLPASNFTPAIEPPTSSRYHGSSNPPPPSMVTHRHAARPAIESGPAQNYYPAPPSYHSGPRGFVPPPPSQDQKLHRRSKSKTQSVSSTSHSYGQEPVIPNGHPKADHWSHHRN